MKKKVIPASLLFVLIVLAVLFVRPVKVLSEESYRYAIKFNKVKIPIEGIADFQGGARCYLNDEDYVWISYSDADSVHEPEGMYIKYGFPWEPVTINKGGS